MFEDKPVTLPPTWRLTADEMRAYIVRYLANEALALSERTAIADVDLYAWMSAHGWTRGTGQADLTRLLRDGRIARFERDGTHGDGNAVRHHRDPTRWALAFYVTPDEKMRMDCTEADHG